MRVEELWQYRRTKAARREKREERRDREIPGAARACSIAPRQAAPRAPCATTSIRSRPALFASIMSQGWNGVQRQKGKKEADGETESQITVYRSLSLSWLSFLDRCVYKEIAITARKKSENV
jgi:hypothetical protein